MHIVAHAQETVKKMLAINMALGPLQIKAERDISQIKTEDVAKLVTAFAELSQHLFGGVDDD